MYLVNNMKVLFMFYSGGFVLRFPVTIYLFVLAMFFTRFPYVFFTFPVGTGAGPQRFFTSFILAWAAGYIGMLESCVCCGI